MDFRKFALLTMMAGLTIVFTLGPVAASEQTNVMGSVHQFIDGLNQGDMKTILAVCASPMSIVDDFPPHEWHGQTACADWESAFVAENKKDGITDGVIALGAPWHVYVTGDRAYVDVPAKYTYKQHGKPAAESGSILTMALKKVAAGWRITGWAWAQR